MEYRVLIADDEPIILSGIRHLIDWSKADAEIIGAAGNGEEAYAIIEREHPDIVITDIKMPVMDGLALAGRCSEEFPDIVFIILTSLEEFSLAKEAIGYGITDYLLKTELDGDRLMKALEKFDYKLGHRFCTYASWWVRQAVARALSAQSRVIRLPIHMLATIRKMNIAEKNFIQLNGNEPTIEELAQIMEMPKERISAIKKMSLQCISLQAPQSSDDPDFTIENFLSDKESDDPMKSLARKMMKERLAEAINQLSEREKQVITMRYGLDGGPCKTLTEVSAIFNVTRERVRQLELKTLEKLRKHSDSGKYLEDFFL